MRIISENKKLKQSPSLFVWFTLYPLQCVVSILIHLPPLYSGSIHFTILNLIYQVFIYSPIQPLYIVIQGDPVKMRLHGRLQSYIYDSLCAYNLFLLSLPIHLKNRRFLKGDFRGMASRSRIFPNAC